MQLPKWNNEETNKEIENQIQSIAQFWKRNPSSPSIKPEILTHWDDLLSEWVADKSLPLYIRKKQSETALYGEIIEHTSGREIVLTDNYPALWSYISAYGDERPSIGDIRKKIQNDGIPIAMGIKRNNLRVKYKCTMMRDPNWRYCHIEGLSIGSRNPVSEIPIEKIERHFKLFLAPSNMFVLPKAWGALGECDVFIKSMRIR